MLRMCAWCGKPFEAKTKRAKFCGDACRKAHNRAQRGGIRLSVPDDPASMPRPRMTEDDIASAVVQAKGAMATFDAGRAKAPKDLRPLCSKMADGMADLFGKVGL